MRSNPGKYSRIHSFHPAFLKKNAKPEKDDLEIDKSIKNSKAGCSLKLPMNGPQNGNVKSSFQSFLPVLLKKSY